MKLRLSMCGVAVIAVLLSGGCETTEKPFSQVAAKPARITRTYAVSDLIRSYDTPKSLSERIDEWIVCLTANVASGLWNDGDMNISADYETESIVVFAPIETQDEVALFLEDLLKMNRQIAAGLIKFE